MDESKLNYAIQRFMWVFVLWEQSI